MKILMLNHNLRGRGSWFRCWHFARQLAARGHQITLVTAAPQRTFCPQRQLLDGVEVLTGPRWLGTIRHDGGWSPEDIAWRSLWALRRRQFDIVHAFEHRPNVALPAVLATWRNHAMPIVDWSDWWCRGGILTARRPWRWLDRAEAWLLEEGLKRWAGNVITVSPLLRQRALDLGLDPQRVHLLPSGCDPQAIQPMDLAQARVQLGWPMDWRVIGFAGFALWDLELLIRAFARVQRQLPEARLCLLGHDREGQLGDLLMGHLDGREDLVIQAGEVPYDRLGSWLGACDVLALPLTDCLANQARWPMKLGDYLSAARPVVVCDVGPTAQFVAREGCGVVCAPTPEAFSNSLLTALHDSHTAARLGVRAREIAGQRLAWSVLAQDLERIYDSLFKGVATPAEK
jgi:glycosyltransferase involved in cell wall biosynthesis